MQYRVLMVDDSRAAFEIVKVLLEDSEFTVAAFCESGEAALAQYGELLPDLVLMDIVMPGMGGLEASAKIKAQWPEARILVASAFDDDFVQAEAKAAGCIGIYQKPFDHRALLQAMRKAVSSDAAL